MVLDGAGWSTIYSCMGLDEYKWGHFQFTIGEIGSHLEILFNELW